MRRGRIFARMREGWAYDEIAREEGLSTERIRQIVSEVLQKRKVDTGADHAKLQLARLERIMHFASEALARGDLRIGALYLKTLDRLDRYQKLAGAAEVYDDEARERLLAKINRVAERLGYDAKPAESEAEGEGAPADKDAGAVAAPDNASGVASADWPLAWIRNS